MSVTKFHTPYQNRPTLTGLPSNGERKVETLGYISRAQKIQNFMNAGIKLAQARLEQFDADVKTPEENFMFNPFRDRGMDFSDLKRNQDKINLIIETRKKEVERKIQLENERVQRGLKNDKNFGKSDYTQKSESGGSVTAEKSPSGGSTDSPKAVS